MSELARVIEMMNRTAKQENVMGLMDGVLGGIVGAGATSLVTGLIEHHGGLSGLVAQFEQQGMGGLVKSWIGNGPNQPVSADQLQQALNPDAVAKMSQRFGMEPQDLLQKLAKALPQAVDRMTPGGTVSSS
jgi:uncharacterized protein YidB (DUF937 family)